MRPPPVKVDDAGVRHDVLSDDVRRVHPDLPSTPAARNAHLARCDAKAYASIRARFPDFTPPHQTASTWSSSSSAVAPSTLLSSRAARVERAPFSSTASSCTEKTERKNSATCE